MLHDDVEAQFDSANPEGVTEDHRYKHWPFRWFRTRRSKQGLHLQKLNDVQVTQRTPSHATDLEPTTTDQTASDLRLQAINSLFGLSIEHVQAWPGILVFCNHLESSFGSLMGDDFDVIWTILGRPMPTNSAHTWHWCLAVTGAFRALQDHNASIENVYQRLIADASSAARNLKPHEKNKVLLAIFAVLCWTSMALKPVLAEDSFEPTQPNPEVSFRVEGSSRIHSCQAARRPITKMFRGFRHQAEDLEAEPATGTTTSMDVLYESSLNYFSISTIGRVRLKWVDSLTAHLSFDRQTRTLSIFRLPTFCVASILRTQDFGILQRITPELLPSNYYTDSPHDDPTLLHRELLLSYRLLFGQSSRSRKLLRDRLSELKKSTGEIDPFLSTLCTAPLSSSFFSFHKNKSLFPPNVFPSFNVGFENTLQESDTYSARDEFPVFGPRLLALQRYNLRQQPSRVRDLWRDRRNPLQWYTFWAVLWIGGFTIILALLQFVVAAAQLYFAIRPPPN